MIHLHDYITSYDFLKGLHQPQIIISDLPAPTNDHSPHQRIRLEDFFANPRLQAVKPTIGIGLRITSQDMLTLNQRYGRDCTWINLGPGVESMINKHAPEEDDITNFLAVHYTITEPIDTDTLLSALQPHHYIRIHNTRLPHTLTTLTREEGIASLPSQHSQEISQKYTILTSSRSADTVMSAVHSLGQDHEIFCNVWVQQSRSNKLSPIFVDHLRQTKYLIIILDHKPTEAIWQYYSHLLKQYNFEDVRIHYMFPQYHLVNSILTDYIMEEAHFDVLAMINYIQTMSDNEYPFE